jgi:hypothetical protein
MSEVLVPEFARDACSSGSSLSTRRRVARRYLTGLSAAGLTAALALTVAVGDASASPAASPAHVVTLTSSSSASTGQLTVKVRYQLERPGRIKLLSVTFSGASKVSLQHPALVLSLRPVLVPPIRRGTGPVGVQAHHPFRLILRIRDARKFSSALPARALATIGKILALRHRILPTAVLAAAVASVIRHNHEVSISTPVGLQAGVLLGPVAP